MPRINVDFDADDLLEEIDNGDIFAHFGLDGLMDIIADHTASPSETLEFFDQGDLLEAADAEDYHELKEMFENGNNEE